MIFDIIILLGLFIFNFLIYYVFKQNFKIKLKTLLIIFFVFCEAILIYGSFIEPRIIKVKQVNISLQSPFLKQNYFANKKPILKIALISDIHTGNFKHKNFIQKLTNKLQKLDFDILLLAGDFVSRNPNSTILLKNLKPIAQQKPVFAVFGNHDYNAAEKQNIIYDYTQTTRKVFNKINIKLLENKNQLVKIKNQKINLIGINSIIAGRNNIQKAFLNINKKYLQILFAHNPDIVLDLEKTNYKPDIILVGHTHGGQIRLPILGSLAHLPIKLSQKYDKGLFKYKDFTLFITSGLGETGTRARLFIPPEIVVLNVYR